MGNFTHKGRHLCFCRASPSAISSAPDKNRSGVKSPTVQTRKDAETFYWATVLAAESSHVSREIFKQWSTNCLHQNPWGGS